MAAVKDVVLTLAPGSSPQKRSVTVAFKLVYQDGEDGQKFRVSVNLFGEDGGPTLGVTLEPLYTFQFGFLFTRPYTTVTAQAGEQSVSWTREVSRGALDEDPGLMGTPPIVIPQADEIYALVTVSSEARSPTLSVVI